MVAIVRTPPQGILLATGAIFVGAAATFDGEDGPVLCLFRRCTGGYCPGCGGSRAAAAAMRGDLAASWAANPWFLLIAVQAVVVGALAAAGRIDWAVRRIIPILILNSVLGVGIWVLRLMTGSIPVPFG